MERFINFRAFLFVFIGAIIGGIFSFHIFSSNLTFFIILTILIFMTVVFVAFTTFFDKTKKFNFLNKFLICFLIGFFIFSSLSCLNFTNFSKNKNIENATVTARVCSVNSKASYYYLILEECKLNDLECNNSSKLSGKISLTVYSNDVKDISIGDIVYFTGNLNKNDLIREQKFQSYYYKNNIKYSSFVDSENFTFQNGSLKFDEKIRENVKQILFTNMSYDNAAICYATIFGDKTLLDEKIYNSFSISGTAHILCVSGLHVGFLVALLYLFFKLFKLKPKYILIVLSIIMLFYCYLCGFSPSVVRASLMSLILCMATTFGTKYDSLSSLSLSGIIILLFKPFYIFDIGFQLSFSACFGIILLMPSFTSFFKKINFDNKFSQAISLTLSAQLGTFPIILHNFEKMSFLSICANIIIVPIFSILFSLLIIFTIINFILPLGKLFVVLELILNFIVFLTKGFGSVTSLIFTTSSFTITYSLIFYLIILCISKFINLKNKTRIISVLSLTVLFCFAFLLQFYPINYNQNLILNTQLDNCTIITNSNNKKVMINVGEGNKNDLSLIKNDLLNYKILKLDALILSSYNVQMQNCIVEICNVYNVERLYVPNNLTENEEKYLFKNLHSTFIFKANEKYYSFDNFNFKIISDINGVFLNIMENNHSFTMLVGNNLDKTTTTYLIKENLSGDFVKFNYINKNYLDSIENFDIILCQRTNIRQANIFSINNLPEKINLKLLKESAYEI